MTDVFMLR